MKTFAQSLILVLLATTVAAQDFDFRNVKWGASTAEIKAAETEGTFFKEEPNAIVYEVQIVSLPAMAIYISIQNQLVVAQYHFIVNHSNANEYLTDYVNVQEALDQKYWQRVPEYVWSNTLFQGDADRYGTAVAAGHLSLIATWELTRTTITHMIRGDNFVVKHTISYKTKIPELVAILEAWQKQQAGSGL